MKLREMSWIEQILVMAARRANGGGRFHPEAYAFLVAHGPEYSEARAHMAAERARR